MGCGVRLVSVAVSAPLAVLGALGALVVAVVLRDVFHTLWHPAGDGLVNR